VKLAFDAAKPDFSTLTIEIATPVGRHVAAEIDRQSSRSRAWDFLPLPRRTGPSRTPRPSDPVSTWAPALSVFHSNALPGLKCFRGIPSRPVRLGRSA